MKDKDMTGMLMAVLAAVIVFLIFWAGFNVFRSNSLHDEDL